MTASGVEAATVRALIRSNPYALKFNETWRDGVVWILKQ
jgi:hypothetical protein